MTPQEKAKDIIESIEFEVWGISVMSKDVYIGAAKVVVDKVIEELNQYSDLRSVLVKNESDDLYSVIERLLYWEEVKIEINRL